MVQGHLRGAEHPTQAKRRMGCDFTKELALGRELLVFGEQFWRPYCHVSDFSKAILTVLNASDNKVAYNVFNVGDTS